jgi:hypothetical protein
MTPELLTLPEHTYLASTFYWSSCCSKCGFLCHVKQIEVTLILHEPHVKQIEVTLILHEPHVKQIEVTLILHEPHVKQIEVTLILHVYPREDDLIGLWMVNDTFSKITATCWFSSLSMKETYISGVVKTSNIR